MFLRIFFALFFVPSSLQASDLIENNVVGVLIDRENGSLVQQQVDDSTTNSQVERMFETIEKMNNLLANMDAQLSAKIEALSKRVDALEANQGSFRRSLIAEWIQIGGDDGKFAKVFTVAANWTEANSICSTLFANLAVVNSEQENHALAALLTQTNEHVFWIGSRVQFQIDVPTDRYHNFTSGRNDGGCAAITREGVWKTRNCQERYSFVCQKTK
ncbi:hypothetical protein L596_002166 [Steinernema carpocapsae]|uniref:C-type lectin domain-containing protein n=1 Tax=Steinernema carpocapsae TaxID=34508 RepID=A0A4U8UNP9_STECR|nr:hypothetical protein L596_002166 [Steinernema carpocapsae]